MRYGTLSVNIFVARLTCSRRCKPGLSFLHRTCAAIPPLTDLSAATSTGCPLSGDRAEPRCDPAARPSTATWTTRCGDIDLKSTRLNSSHANISYAVFCLKKKQTSTHLGFAYNSASLRTLNHDRQSNT